MLELWPRVATPRDGQFLVFGDEKVWLAWKRYPQAKRLKLLVSADGPRLSLPPRCAEKTALAFVESHREWIYTQWQKHQAVHVPALQIGVSTHLPVLAQRLPIIWQEDKALQIYRHDDHWRIHTSKRSSERQLQAALLHYYQQWGLAWFTQRMQAYLPSLPCAPSAIHIKPLRALWGSLNVSNVVRLDVALLLASPAAAEYVLVHELCHLMQRNHSPQFWREVEKRCPYWRDHRDYLKAYGQGFKSEAKAIFGR